MQFKAVAFDLDGTLVTERSSWYKLHSNFGTLEKSKTNMHNYEAGKITYDLFMSRDIGLWKPVPSKANIEQLLLNYTLCANVKDVITTLQQKGYELFIVTTAPDILAVAVANELKIKNLACNYLLFDNNNKILPKAIFNVDLLNKDEAFRKLVKKSKLKCQDCIAVGDSKYDERFLKSSGLGIGFKADEKLREKVDISINDMNELLAFI